MTDRGRVQVADALVGGLTAVAALAAGPAYYDLVSRLSASAGPLSDLLLQLVVPFVLVGVLVSVAVSARRRPG